MEAIELHAADDLNVRLLWDDFNRLFNGDRDSLVGMLLDIKKQMTYPSTAHFSPAPKRRTGWVRRVISKLKG